MNQEHTTRLKPISDIQQQLQQVRADKHKEYQKPVQSHMHIESSTSTPDSAVTPPGVQMIAKQSQHPPTTTPESPEVKHNTPEVQPSSTCRRPDGAWPKGTVLIAGDSIIGGIEERRLTGRRVVKVRSFGGARIDDMVFYITPLLRKLPSVVILHVSCNNSDVCDAEHIVDGLLDLKTYIEDQVPGVRVILSTPTIRSDNNIAAKILEQVTGILKSKSVEIIDNNNIDKTGLGQRGLHLNMKGTARLAMNYIDFLKSY